jgi:hypothetical protein
MTLNAWRETWQSIKLLEGLLRHKNGLAMTKKL